MSKRTTVTYTCDFCHKESANKEFVENSITLYMPAKEQIKQVYEKLMIVDFTGELCDPCRLEISTFLKKGKEE